MLTLAVVLVGVTAYVGLGRRSDAQVNAPETNPNGDLALARSTKPGIRVLFIGNSFTSYNNLPGFVSSMAKKDKGALPIYAVGYDPGGQTLQQHAADQKLADLINSTHWNYVVLQEQSQRVAFPSGQRRQLVDPFVSDLNFKIQAANSHPLLYMTWGQVDGDRANFPDDTFKDMNGRLRDGYNEIGAALKIPVAPVGTAWEDAHNRDASLELWAADGKHPAIEGSFLAATVFYWMIEHRDPANSSFTAGISQTHVQELRQAAANAPGTRESAL